MSRRASRATLFVVALAGCSPAVGRRADAPADTAAAAAPAAAPAGASAPSVARGDQRADSVRGVVERIGSDPTTQLVVRGADGTVCALQLSAPPPFEGLEVTLWGRRAPGSATMVPGVSCAFAAERYAVRAVDGVAAVDGILRVDGTAFTIETANVARRPVRDVPAPLRTQVGARIYWAGPLDRAPMAYGVLVPAP